MGLYRLDKLRHIDISVLLFIIPAIVMASGLPEIRKITPPKLEIENLGKELFAIVLCVMVLPR